MSGDEEGDEDKKKEVSWMKFKDALTKAEDLVQEEVKEKKNHWISDETKDVCEEKRKHWEELVEIREEKKMSKLRNLFQAWGNGKV